LNRELIPYKIAEFSWPLSIALALIAVAVGGLLAFAGPLITVGVLGALAVGLFALTNLEIGLWGTIAISALLPFAALPIKIVVTPTFLDLALAGVLGVYLLQWMSGQRRRLTLTPAHAPLALLMLLAVLSFVAGIPNGPLTTSLMRHFAELLLNMALVFILVDYIDSQTKLNRLVGVVIVCGVAAAAVGIGLYFLPEELSERALSALRIFNYPSGGVLRYIEDNPENAQRAIATSVDPNVLGGLLAIIGGLLAPQLLAPHPTLKARWLTYLGFGVVLVCIVLTFSRGAMTALGVALVVIALARYRRTLVFLPVIALVLLLLPATQDYVAHFIEGLQGQDLATQMRLGEYKDAAILISRYPLGVGFSGAPEIDIYLGVSSAYLIIAEEMGLTGLAAFLLVVGVIFGWSAARRKQVYADEWLTPLWLGAHAGLVAALAIGVVDHYFFNLDFQHASALFWIFAGLCLAATRLAGEPRPSPLA